MDNHKPPFVHRPPHDHHPIHRDEFDTPINHFVHQHGPDFGADMCDDQLPIINTAGAGPSGDSVKVIIHEDAQTISYQNTILGEDGVWREETITDDVIMTQWIETRSVDGRSGAETPIDVSDNFNGGILYHTYNYRPWTHPPTFTITFWYVRNDTHEDLGNGIHSYVAWRWTTRPIPYIPDYETGGDPNSPGAATVGTGVGALYIRADVNDEWMSKLIYPPGIGPVENSEWPTGGPINPNVANSPAPKADWSVNITLGLGGDIQIPNIYNIAKILGWSPDSLIDLVENGDDDYLNRDLFPEYEDVKDYIDKGDKGIKDVIQPPPEWLDPGINLPGDGDPDGFGPGNQETIWDKMAKLNKRIKDLEALLPADVTYLTQYNMKLAAGNINLYGKNWGDASAVIMTHNVTQNAANMREGDQLGRAII